jgi:hypothetical protein
VSHAAPLMSPFVSIPVPAGKVIVTSYEKRKV